MKEGNSNHLQLGLSETGQKGLPGRDCSLHLTQETARHQTVPLLHIRLSPRFDFLSGSSTLHPETSFSNLLLNPPCLQAKTSTLPVLANVSLRWKCRKHSVSLCSAVGTTAAQWNVTELVTLAPRKKKGNRED